MKRIIFIFLTLAFSLSVCAQTRASGSGLITSMYGQSFSGNGILLFTTETQSNLTSCASSKRFSMVNSNNGGQLQIALAMMAFAANKKVYIHGWNDCTTWSDSQRVDYILVNR